MVSKSEEVNTEIGFKNQRLNRVTFLELSKMLVWLFGHTKRGFLKSNVRCCSHLALAPRL